MRQQYRPTSDIWNKTDSFPIAQFQMTEFTVPYRYDRNGKGRWLPLYIRKDPLSRLLISKSKCNSFNCGQLKKKGIVSELITYNPHQNLISNHCMLELSYWRSSKSFDNFIFIGDFNASTNHNSMMNISDLNGLIKKSYLWSNLLQFRQSNLHWFNFDESSKLLSAQCSL